MENCVWSLRKSKLIFVLFVTLQDTLQRVTCIPQLVQQCPPRSTLHSKLQENSPGVTAALELTENRNKIRIIFGKNSEILGSKKQLEDYPILTQHDKFSAGVLHRYYAGAVYSRSSRKRPPREFRKVVATRAGRLRECFLVSDHIMKQ